LGLLGPKRSIITQNCVFAVVIIGLYDPKTGSKLGFSGPKRGHKLGCNTLNPKPGSNLGYGPQNGVRIGSITLKIDLWTAFGYTGFSVYGLFGIWAFGYTGFWVYGLFGTQAIEVPYHPPNQGPKLGSQIRVPNQGPKSGSQTRVPYLCLSQSTWHPLCLSQSD
jgi:hypothetical protein